MTVRKAGKRTTKKRSDVVVDIMADNLDSELDSLEKEVSLNQIAIAESKDRVSTGLLALDLMFSGGTTPGSFITFFGGEQSAKSTLAQTILNKAILDEVPRLFYFDYEGSFQPDFFEKIGRVLGSKYTQDEIFGLRDNNGELVKRPLLRYYAESIGDKMFNTMHQLMKNLPSKLYRSEQWWYVFDPTKENKAKYKNGYDSDLFKDTGKLWLPAPDGSIQALFVCDSFPAMLFENQDGEDRNKAMAADAREFAYHIKRVKGRMQEKRVSLIGVNQLRDRPGVVYGSPHYEPCGNSLKFNSDARVQLTSRSVLGGKGPIEEEESIYGGADHYMYKNLRAGKNKLSTPNIDVWARIWTKDHQGQGHGFDPVFDSFFFLKETGRLTGTKNRMKISLKRFNDGEHKPMKWIQFKKLILGNSQMIKEVFTELGIEGKPFKLRDLCFQMFRREVKSEFGVTSVAMRDYFTHQNAGVKNEAED